MFDVEDEDAAFAYAEERMRAASSRLAVTNRASEVPFGLLEALQAKDIDAAIGCYSDQFVYDDRRRLSGDPIEDSAGLRAATERIIEQYTGFEGRTLAVRGERLTLLWSRWSDDAGNETIYLHVFEVDDDGRIDYAGRFDEDDFEGAYRELERRYYAGEGAAFAEGGTTATEFTIALNRADFDRAFDELTLPELRVENRSRSAFPDRTAAELRATFEDLRVMVASVRDWASAVCWLSPTWFISRHEREAVGQDGERFEWTRLLATEVRDGRIASLCEFEIDDEEQAFAYAEERMRAASSRLAVTNRASELAHVGMTAMQARDIEAQISVYSDQFVYDDRRRLGGDPIQDRAELRAAVSASSSSTHVFEARTLAVRGERLHLAWSRWSDDAGNETVQLHVHELGDDERIAYEGRFDEDDFEGAYRELERRYYAGEGAAFAEAGATTTEWVIAMNRGDFDRAFGELSAPRFARREPVALGLPASLGRRAARQLRGAVRDGRLGADVGFGHLLAVADLAHRRVSSARPSGWTARQYAWTQAARGRNPRRATRVDVRVRDRRRGRGVRLRRGAGAGDRQSAGGHQPGQRARAMGLTAAMQPHDVDAVCRGLLGSVRIRRSSAAQRRPHRGSCRAAGRIERIFEQYTAFRRSRTLAVRGERLALSGARWSDDAGNETTIFYVIEIGDDGRITYEGRFDEDDFEGAYRELERRYYAGEGAAFAEAGATATEWVIAMNRGDFDRAFGELSTPDLRAREPVALGVPGSLGRRAARQLRGAHAMVASARTWVSALHWVSPTWLVCRLEREAVGLDGEQYRGRGSTLRVPRRATHVGVRVRDRRRGGGVRLRRGAGAGGGQPARGHEPRQRRGDARLTRRCTPTTSTPLSRPTRISSCTTIGGGSAVTRSRIGTGCGRRYERVFEQFTALRSGTCWRCVATPQLLLGFAGRTTRGTRRPHLYVFELGDDGRIGYRAASTRTTSRALTANSSAATTPARARRSRRAGEVPTDWMIALNRDDFDRAFGELTAPDFRLENRSRSAFPDRSAQSSAPASRSSTPWSPRTRTWLSALCWVSPGWCVTRI